MSFMLPAAPSHARSITGVAQELLDSLTGQSPWGTARSAVLCVVDGLGALQLRAHAGHARRLSAMMTKKSVALSVFPSTTAAALTSLLTGVAPGEHGMVGYRVMNPNTGRLVNQLSGWEGVDPATWQQVPTIFEQAKARGFTAYAVGPAEYAGSEFSAAILRGATYIPHDEVRTRLARALALADGTPGTIVYCYLPEVDKAGHKFGVASEKWIEALEEVDSAFAAKIPSGVGLAITADHGMIDVPHHRHVLLEPGDPRLDGVAAIGGEPRMLHVYLEDPATAQVAAEIWRQYGGTSADIVTRDDAIEAGLYGPVSDAVVERIGHVLVIARGNWAYYDAAADPRAQGMIGQHGALTPEERFVPLIRAGAYHP